MNPTDPEEVPTPDEPTPDSVEPKPWHKPQDEHQEDAHPAIADGGAGTGDLIDAGAGALNVAGGAAEIADAAGSALEGAGGALEAAGGCLEGCRSCSLAVLLMLFAAAGTAMALFR
jgi:hypothetical protein